MFCSRCGSVAATPSSKAYLFQVCPAADPNGERRMSNGSNSRLGRIRYGKYPDAAAAKAAGQWPSGEPASQQLSVHVYHPANAEHLQREGGNNLESRPCTSHVCEYDPEAEAAVYAPVPEAPLLLSTYRDMGAKAEQPHGSDSESRQPS